MRGTGTHAARPLVATSARYAGLAGAVLLAVAGWRGGAGVDLPATTRSGAYHPWPVGCWLAGTLLLVGAWWALRHGPPSTRWAYGTAGLWLLPLAVTPPLGSRDVYSYVCQGWSWTHHLDPYRVGVAAAGCPWTESVAPIWRDTPAPYGPLSVLLAGLAVTLGGSLVASVVLLRLVAVAGVLLTAYCLPALARSAGVPAARATWLVLACPLVGVHLVAGAHNDAVGVGLLAAALLVLVRRSARPGVAVGRRLPVLLVAGGLLGLAVAVKVVAVVVLPFAVLAAVPGRPTVRALLSAAAWLTGAAATSLLVVSAATGLGLGWTGGLAHSGDSAQWTSPPTAVGFTVDYLGRLVGRSPDAVPVVRAVAMVVLTVLLVAIWAGTWHRLRTRPGPGRTRLVLVGAGVALAATVALAPVFHPWYAVWPLVVLAVAATRTTWFLLPCAVASLLTLPDGTGLARFTKAPGAVLMTALVAALAVAAIRVVPSVLRRERGRPAGP